MGLTRRHAKWLGGLMEHSRSNIMITRCLRGVAFGLIVGGVLALTGAGGPARGLADATTTTATTTTTTTTTLISAFEPESQSCTCPVQVALVADSLVSRTRDEYPVTWGVWAEGGRSSARAGAAGGLSGREAVTVALQSLTPDGTLVVELGANDVVQGTTAAEFRAFVDWVFAAAGPGRDVVWVTPYVGASTTTVNRSIDLRAAVLAAFPGYPGATSNRVVVDWFAMARYNTLMLMDDMVHLTPEGGAVLAETIVQAVEAVTG
jgi:hypothetical protein